MIFGQPILDNICRWLDSERSCCDTIASFGDKDKLSALAARVCCQGADLLSGCRLSGAKCCSQIDVKHLNVDSENPVTLFSRTVTTGGSSEQGVDVLVPLCQRKPSSLCLCNEGIKEEKLRVEVAILLSTEDLLPLLLEE
ncbi:glutathione gamma-glutamylcysteinyltransferase 3-like, partial [Trifolium medium]|nr:glutathione gamma-glutamylcysteinyltransferase 3-like [Trifolium medium]